MNGQIARLIAESLASDPDGWECDGYNLFHRQHDITIWVANRIWGLSVIHRGTGAKMGGVVLFGWLSPWRRCIWKAYREWSEGHIEAALGIIHDSLAA